jgi:hypothetical protein
MLSLIEHHLQAALLTSHSRQMLEIKWTGIQNGHAVHVALRRMPPFGSSDAKESLTS